MIKHKINKINQWTYSTVMILFMFNMINREFKLLGIVDLRVLTLLLITGNVFFNYKKTLHSIKTVSGFNKKVCYFYLSVLLSSMVSIVFKKEGLEIKNFLSLIFLYIYGFAVYFYLSVNKKHFKVNVLIMTVVISILTLVLSMYWAYSERNLYNHWSSIIGLITNERTRNLIGGNFRLAGYAEDANYASYSLIVGTIMVLFLIKSRYKYIFVAFCTVAYVFTASKTLLVGSIVVCIIYFSEKLIIDRKDFDFSFKYYKFKRYLVITLLSASIIISFILYMTKFELTHIVGSSMGLRFEMWKSAFRLFTYNPVFGGGLGAARHYFAVNGGWVVQTHNTILQIASENGIISLVIFISLMISVTNSRNKMVSLIGGIFCFFCLSYELIYLSFFPFVLLVNNLFSDSIKTNEKYNMFFVNSLKSGGAEKAVENLISVEKEGIINYIVLQDGYKKNLEYLGNNVIIHSSMKNPFATFLSIIKVNTIIDFHGIRALNLSNAHLLKSHLFSKFVKISDRTLYIFHSTSRSFTLTSYHKILYKFIYNNRIIGVLSDTIANDLIVKLEIEPKEYFVFKNSIPKERIEQVVENKTRVQDENCPYILFCGRLEEVKRPDFFINMFFESELYLDFKAIILGEGSLKNNLREQVKELGITDRVEFKGYMSEPFDFFRNSSATILCSDFEASPMVILECLYSGGRIVSYDCDFGPREVLKEELKNYLITTRDYDVWGEVVRGAVEYYPDEESFKLIFDNRDNIDTLSKLEQVFKHEFGGENDEIFICN